MSSHQSFHLHLKQGAILKKIIESLKDIVSTVTITVSKSGLELQAFEKFEAALFRVEFSKKGFSSFKVKKGSSWTVDVANLVKAVNLMKPKDEVSIYMEDREEGSQDSQ